MELIICIICAVVSVVSAAVAIMCYLKTRCTTKAEGLQFSLLSNLNGMIKDLKEMKQEFE